MSVGAAGSGVRRRPVHSEPGWQRLVPEPGLHRSCGLPEGPRTAGLPEQPGPAEEPSPAAAHGVTTPTPSALLLPSTSHFYASSTEVGAPDPLLSLSHLLDGWKYGCLDGHSVCRLWEVWLSVELSFCAGEKTEVRRSSSVFKPACLICLTTCLSASAY